mgnify:CR=1 FL=1|jgi:hypothetical protein
MDSEKPAQLSFPVLPMIAFGACVVIGLIAGALYPLPDWSLGLRLGVFGAFGGFCGLILTFWRLLM